MKLITYALTPLDTQLHSHRFAAVVPTLSHVHYRDPGSTAVELVLRAPEPPGISSATSFAYISLSPDEAEQLGQELIVRAWRARNNK